MENRSCRVAICGDSRFFGGPPANGSPSHSYPQMQCLCYSNIFSTSHEGISLRFAISQSTTWGSAFGGFSLAYQPNAGIPKIWLKLGQSWARLISSSFVSGEPKVSMAWLHRLVRRICAGKNGNGSQSNVWKNGKRRLLSLRDSQRGA